MDRIAVHNEWQWRYYVVIVSVLNANILHRAVRVNNHDTYAKLY